MSGVILADDNEGIRIEFASRLRGEGIPFLEFDSGTAFLKELPKIDEPPAAFFDIQMPGDGVVAAAALRKRFPRTPVYFLTAHLATEQDRAHKQVKDARWIDKSPGWLDRVTENAKIAIAFFGVVRAYHDDRIRMGERYEGIVEQVHKDTVIVAYEIGKDIVHQTYERSQFLEGRLPQEGDRLAVYVHVALISPQSLESPPGTEVVHEQEQDWKEKITGPVKV